MNTLEQVRSALVAKAVDATELRLAPFEEKFYVRHTSETGEGVLISVRKTDGLNELLVYGVSLKQNAGFTQYLKFAGTPETLAEELVASFAAY